MRQDVDILVELLYAAQQGRQPRLTEAERSRSKELEHLLRVASQNAACERTTAEFRRDGELVLLTR